MARRRKKKDPNEGMPPRKPNGQLLRPPMRPVSRSTSFEKLRACRCFPEVHERVVKGYSPAQVAKFIQDENDEYTDASHNTLKTTIERYRRALPPGTLAQHALSVDHIAAIEEAEEAIDTIQEMTRMYRMQLKRIKVDFQTEQAIGKLFPTMTQEMRVAGEFLKGIAQLQMDLGIHTRHLGTIDVDVEARMLGQIDARYEGTEIGKVLADPKKRRRLMNIAEHALSLASRGIEITKNEDGELELVATESAVEDPS